MKQTSSGLKHIDEQAGKIFLKCKPKQPASPQQSSQHPPQPTAQRVPSRYATDWQRPANRGQPRQKACQAAQQKSRCHRHLCGTVFGICFLQGAYQAVTALFPSLSNFRWLPIFDPPAPGSGEFLVGCPLHRNVSQTQVPAVSTGHRHTSGLRCRRTGKGSKQIPKICHTGFEKHDQDRSVPQGHLDDEGTCLILTDEAYGQYRTGQANRKLRELEEAKIQENPDGLEAVIAEGRAGSVKSVKPTTPCPDRKFPKSCSNWRRSPEKFSPVWKNIRRNFLKSVGL